MGLLDKARYQREVAWCSGCGETLTDATFEGRTHRGPHGERCGPVVSLAERDRIQRYDDTPDGQE